MVNKCKFYDVWSLLKIVYDEASTVALSAGQKGGKIDLNIHGVHFALLPFVFCQTTFSKIWLDISLPWLFVWVYIPNIIHPQALCLCTCCSVQFVCDGDAFNETGSKKFQSLSFIKTDACVTFPFHTIIAIGHPNGDCVGRSQKQHGDNLSKSWGHYE